MKKILIIIPLIFSLGLIGCTGNDESNKQEKETSKVEERKDTLPEIKLVLKDMYISINENKDNDKVCREKIEKLNENIIKYGDFSYKSGIECMEELLKEKEEFTAVFATSDEMALGALSVMHRQNIKVPEEISIIGYDNTLIAQMSNPPLTTVSQPLYEMGIKAFDRILDMLESGKSEENIILSHKIVERETVKLLE